jgi:hypothetical protein
MAILEPTSTLQAIQTKVRRLTRSPSTAQLTDVDLQNYINTFVVYDFPEQLRTFNLKQQFSFICNPYQDVYVTDTSLNINNPLYNFQNLYLTVHPPVYIAGFPAFYTQSREQFYNIYPTINNILSIGTFGDGGTMTFSGVITNNTGPSTPAVQNQSTVLLQNNVLFSSIDIFGNGLSLIDVPIQDSTTGNPTVEGNLYIPGTEPTELPLFLDPSNNINYVTGQFTITFPTAPAAGQFINSQTVPLVTALPQSMLFYQDQFTLRPIPDQPYRINFEVFVRPTALLNLGQTPQLEEYWQYIAYGAAKKIFEDRMEMESVQMIMPEFKTQERLCLRRTLVQYANERSATIYTEASGGAGGWGWWGTGGGGSF